MAIQINVTHYVLEYLINFSKNDKEYYKVAQMSRVCLEILAILKSKDKEIISELYVTDKSGFSPLATIITNHEGSDSRVQRLLASLKP